MSLKISVLFRKPVVNDVNLHKNKDDGISETGYRM